MVYVSPVNIRLQEAAGVRAFFRRFGITRILTHKSVL